MFRTKYLTKLKIVRGKKKRTGKGTTPNMLQLKTKMPPQSVVTEVSNVSPPGHPSLLPAGILGWLQTSYSQMSVGHRSMRDSTD